MPQASGSSSSRWINVLLVLGAFVLALGVFEGAARLLRQPCSDCWGTLLGLSLPPYRVITEDDFADSDRQVWHRGLVVDGARITGADLWGIMREDPHLGYVPQEDTVSPNGWWQTNRLGARSRHEVETPKPPGIIRVLAFGDSFANSSRVPQEETWTEAIARFGTRLEVVNFGVDGYSMAQAYLHYRDIKGRMDHDGVLLLFPPRATLARDVNTLRKLVGWKMPLPVPRFVRHGDRLQLVEGLYRSREEAQHANAGGVSPALREYLLTYDAWYFPGKYERRSFLDDFVWMKLAKRFVYTLREERLLDAFMDPSSEAVLVSRAIIEAMAEEVAADGKWFLLVFTPVRVDLPRYETDAAFRERWETMVTLDCPAAAVCLDLMAALRAQPPEEIDAGYDGTHYGPRANAHIAEAVRRQLETLVPGLHVPVRSDSSAPLDSRP